MPKVITIFPAWTTSRIPHRKW